jgi:hypothetical protein
MAESGVEPQIQGHSALEEERSARDLLAMQQLSRGRLLRSQQRALAANKKIPSGKPEGKGAPERVWAEG